MKKILVLLLVVVMILVMAACGEKEAAAPAAPASSSQTASAAPVASGDFAFEYNGASVKPGDDIASIDVLADANSVFEAESCAFQGLDKVFSYSGFEISTNPIDGKDIIASILLKDDSVTTAEGVYIGSSVEDVVKAYGEPEIEGDYCYTKGCTINFIILDDEVASIEYL